MNDDSPDIFMITLLKMGRSPDATGNLPMGAFRRFVRLFENFIRVCAHKHITSNLNSLFRFFRCCKNRVSLYQQSPSHCTRMLPPNLPWPHRWWYGLRLQGQCKKN